MIPTRTSRPFGRTSPRVSDTDLARLIDRTIEMRVKAKREQGFAAFNIGCDGRKRTTMFDGSACQTEGEVCIAVRQDGISACIEAPTSGNGLTLAAVTFTDPVCEPVTGWWIVDEDGYMYRVPTALITAADYWPMVDDPDTFTSVTIQRAGTWATLMCGADLSIPLNGEGGAEWVRDGEGADWYQLFYASIGGLLTEITTAPTITATSEVGDVQNNVTVVGGGGVATVEDVPAVGIVGSYWFDGQDANGDEISTFEEYQAKIGWDGDTNTLTATLGVKALIGASEPPDDYPTNTIPFATVTLIRTSVTWLGVVYDRWLSGDHVGDPFLAATVTTVVAAGDSIRYFVNAEEFAATPVERYRAVLLRDLVAPNAGSRYADVTLPTADTGIVTGAVRVAYGYPLGVAAGIYAGGTDLAPYPVDYTESPPGTVETDCAGRVLGDMALAYRRGLAVEYGDAHVNLAGDDITDLSSFVSLAELDYAHGPALDVATGLLGLPSTEVAILGASETHDIRTGSRYRIRPAPDTAITVTVEHQAKGAWDDDPNIWVSGYTYGVSAWPDGPAAVTLNKDMTAEFAPGRGVECVLYETNDIADTYRTAPVTYECLLGPTTAGVTTLYTRLGGALTLVASTLSTRRLVILGYDVHVSYGWTAVDASGHETALSPLSDFGTDGYEIKGWGPVSGAAAKPVYSIKLTVPVGPAGTVSRNIYRWIAKVRTVPAFSNQDGATESPWHYGDFTDPEWIDSPGGGLYDRALGLLATIADNVTTEMYDEDLTLTNLGVRPPSPLVYTGPITVEAPAAVHLLQPLSL